MAHPYFHLAVIVCATLLLGSASGQTAPPRDSASDASPRVPQPSDTIGAIKPIVPPVPPSQTVMSVECAVPQSKLADRATLPNLARQLRTNSKPVILAVGSASTWGAGASRRTRDYPERLESILEKAWAGKDIEIINRGVSGEVASMTASRLLDLAAEYRPNLVLWQLGTNDAVLRIRKEQFDQTVRSTVRSLKDAGIDVVLVGLQYTPKWGRDSQYYAIRDALYKIAKEEKVLYVRRYAAMDFVTRAHKNLQAMARDNFQLDDLGFQCMADHIAQAVIANLFIRRPKKGEPSGKQ